MSIELHELGFAMEYANWALEAKLWDGKEIPQDQFNEFKNALISKLFQRISIHDLANFKLQRQDTEFAYSKSWGGGSKRDDLKDVFNLKSPHGAMIVPNGFFKSCKKFWKEHKAEILIGVAIAAVVTAVAIGAICAAGAAASATAGAVASGSSDHKNNSEQNKNTPADSEIQESSPRILNAQLASSITYPRSDLLITDDGVIINGAHLPFCEALNPESIAKVLQIQNGNMPNPVYHSYFAGSNFPTEPEQILSQTFQTLDAFESNYNITICDESSDNRPNRSSSFSLEEQNLTDQLINRDFEDSLDCFWSNYAFSILSGSQINKSDFPPPFKEISLIGDASLSTVHYHCGINNDERTITNASEQLQKTLNGEFVVQPHLINSNSIIEGLSLVSSSKAYKPDLPKIKQELVFDQILIPDLALINNENVEKSYLPKSIDYEVSLLSKIACNIIKTGNSKLKQVHVAFSHGGYIISEALKRLPAEYQNTVILITEGSTVIVNNDLAHKVYNLIGEKDWASKHCNGGMKKIEASKISAIVILVPQTETETIVGGHYFLQPDYQKAILKIINEEISEKYEIY